jgi:hypothetical protein
MRNADFKTFGQWLSNRMEVVQLSPPALASALDQEDDSHIRRLCDNQARLSMKDWPAAAKLLQIRLDEFLIVVEYFHSDWVAEYDAFISNCLRYLLWRVETSHQQERSWPEKLLSITLEEVIEPACTGRFYAGVDRRIMDRRRNKNNVERENRIQPRRLTDLIHYLKNLLGVVSLFTIWASGIDLMRAGGL